MQLLRWHSGRIGRGMAARGGLARAEAVAQLPPARHTGGWAGSHASAAVPDETETLTARLHSLEAVFAPLASSYAHPRELEEQPQFAEAVRLLQDPDVPLDTVMQYVLGTNWTLACAALAALIGRPDRDEAVDDVAGALRQALSLADVLRARVFRRRRAAAAGRRAGRRRQGLVARQRDHARASSATTSPSASASATRPSSARRCRRPHASPPGTIKAFLQRVNHRACRRADRAARHLPARQHRSHASSPRSAASGRTARSSSCWSSRRRGARPWSAAEAASLQTPARSLLVSGDHRVGKTSFLRLLAQPSRRRGLGACSRPAAPT